jgi:hypothetical protein
MNPRLLVPRASGFNPKSIAGLEWWLDAADTASVTLDSGRVAAWNDKSGKSRHASNNTSGSTQPDYIAAAHNGRHAVRFDAVSEQVLTVPSSTAMFNFLHDGTLSYIAYVAKVGTTATPDAQYGLFGNNAIATNIAGFGIAYSNLTAFSLFSRLRIMVAANSAASARAETNNTVTFNTLQLFDATLDVSNGTAANRLVYRFNGGSDVKPNTATGAPASTGASSNWLVGRNSSFGGFLTGDLCEILIYSQHPTAASQASIRRYLARKWGVTLA